MMEGRSKRPLQGDGTINTSHRTVGIMVPRILFGLIAIGTLVIISAGLFSPKAPTPTNQPSSSSSDISVGLEVGDAAPNFTLATLTGKKVSLSDYRGTLVMLNFWYATCPGCLVEMPDMQKFYAEQQAAHKKFVILGVNIADDAQTARQFAQHKALTYPLVLDSQHQVANLYALRGTPTSLFIDSRGIIRANILGPVDDVTLRQTVTKMSGNTP